jgi:hypothetical protein
MNTEVPFQAECDNQELVRREVPIADGHGSLPVNGCWHADVGWIIPAPKSACRHSRSGNGLTQTQNCQPIVN